MAAHGVGAAGLGTLTVRLPEGRARFLAAPRMLDIDCRHLLALTLLDGTLTFAAAHDGARTRDPAVVALRERVQLVGDPALSTPEGPVVVEYVARDGRTFAHRVTAAAVRGEPVNPMPRAEVEAKALDLLATPLGAARAQRLIERVWALERVADVRELRPLLQA
jgi:2-methylcitrate dehydratase PrpD